MCTNVMAMANQGLKKKRNKKKQTVRKINNSEIRPTGHKSTHIVKSQKQGWLRLEADVWPALKWI